MMSSERGSFRGICKEHTREVGYTSCTVVKQRFY
jgi:hypothetical protein